MSGLATITNAPASMITRHGLSYIQPSAISLSVVLFVQEPALQLLLLYTHGLILLPSLSSTLLLLAGTHVVSKLVEMSDN
jgi:hypothetical protein